MAINKLLVICGPTATGKTELAINLAKKINGEIVSADSRQVYKYMNIGTGKDIGNIKYQISNIKSISNNKFQTGYYLMNGIRVWLYDIVNPDYQFNVADYVKCANLVIGDILKRGKLPILVGGTGFYIKGVVDGIETLGIPPNWGLRKRLANFSIVQLLNYLKKLDAKKWREMNESDRNNPRRLIRAIEITLNLKSQISNLKSLPRILELNNLFVGLTAPYKILYDKIDQRVEGRVKSGIEKEIKYLLDMGYSFENSVLGTTIGYREWRSYFEGKSTLKEVIDKWKFAEHAYSRRQMTWFKKDKRIQWFNISESGWKKRIERLISKWMKNC